MEWIYSNNEDNTARYTLGIRGTRPLICFGINPSTAEPGNLDNTVKSVARIAAHNGYDSWIMLNLYPQRATDPNDMHSECDSAAVKQNAAQIRSLLAQYRNPDIWVAWGTLIEKRPFLKHCLREIIEALSGLPCRWISIGKRTKAGHPHHPLYLRTDSPIEDFDIEDYIATV